MKRFFTLMALSSFCCGYLCAQTADLAGSYYHFSLAKMHEIGEEYGEAISEFEKAIALDPKSAQLRVTFAETLWKGGEIRRAVEECHKATELEPNSSAAHFLLGRIYSAFPASEQADVIDKAIQEFERAVELDPEHFQALYKLGQLQFAKKNYRLAADVFARFLQLRPWIVQAYQIKARAHIELNEIEEAIKGLEASLNYHGGNQENLKLLGKLYEQTKQYDKARELYSQSLESASDPDIQFRLALLLSEAKRFTEAVSILRELKAAFPEHVQIKIALGRAHKGQKRYAEAAQVFQEVLEVEPSHFRANYELAETLAFLGGRQQAIERFLHLLETSESDQDRTSIQTNLAFLYQDMRQFEKAVELFRTVMQENSEDNLAGLRLVYALKEAGQLQEALTLSDRLLKKYENETYEETPTKSYFVIGRAQILSAADELEKAIDLLNREIDRHSEPEDLYLAASQLYVDHKKYKKAERIIKERMSRYSDSERMQFQLGAIYERQGDVDQAEAVFEKILEKNPEHAGVLNYLGYMLADRGARLREALDYIRKAVEIEPHNGAYLDSLGWVYFKLDQLKQAELNFAQAVRITDDDPTIYDHMGDLYYKLGQYDTARKYYQRSILFATEKEEQKKVQKKLIELRKRLSKKSR
ncbi:MAG: tetratricopeptide repeat protein [Acidobacteriota bacterium]